MQDKAAVVGSREVLVEGGGRARDGLCSSAAFRSLITCTYSRAIIHHGHAFRYLSHEARDLRADRSGAKGADGR